MPSFSSIKENTIYIIKGILQTSAFWVFGGLFIYITYEDKLPSKNDLLSLVPNWIIADWLQLSGFGKTAVIVGVLVVIVGVLECGSLIIKMLYFSIKGLFKNEKNIESSERQPAPILGQGSPTLKIKDFLFIFFIVCLLLVGVVIFLIGFFLFIGNISGYFVTFSYAGYITMTIGGILFSLAQSIVSKSIVSKSDE